eukprot:3018134-Amphidinium_carterae.1
MELPSLHPLVYVGIIGIAGSWNKPARKSVRTCGLTRRLRARPSPDTCYLCLVKTTWNLDQLAIIAINVREDGSPSDFVTNMSKQGGNL